MAAAEDAEEGSSDEDNDAETKQREAGKKDEEPLKPGMARIIRDEQGNVVSIVVGTADGAEVEEKVRAPERTGESSDEEDEGESGDEEEAAAPRAKKAKKASKGKGKAAQEAHEDDDEATPWGKPMRDWDAAPAAEHDFGALEGVAKAKDVRQGIPLFGAGRNVEAKTDVVRGASPPLSPLRSLAPPRQRPHTR